MSEQALVQEWQPFFAALAGASAALAGLVFVAMSLHPQAILVNQLSRIRAFGAAAGFLIGVVWALIMLLPARIAPVGSLLLIVVGVGGSAFFVRQQIRVRKIGMSVVRVVVGDLLVPTPIVAGFIGFLEPASELPFVLLAISACLGLFLLFSQSWTLVLHSVISPHELHHPEPRSERNPVGREGAVTQLMTTVGSGSGAARMAAPYREITGN